MEKKELAKKSAIARSKAAPVRGQAQGGVKPLSGKDNQLAFFTEEA